ncbi:GTP cyclohydrolase IIa [Haloarcula sp. S1CR25-12]|uniref:GTP cyclohydrolase III n=1 Tax=Haloarcula saliterrae TaxID=2950534 RepID=A0ABU2FFG9_9EURY|nr:GTP cyclohydrolase IIa [Haloarcula sp. S1CR25-12]MDS0260481.1 GTP cyclohydrolase IIa [Haloarcula sp. S1CR25-12]
MTNTQVSLIQLDNYGPWTTTPEPRREVDLQTLQSRLFADIAQLVGARDGYAFFGRFDNIVAVTNGLDRGEHERIQGSLGNRYPVTASVSIASGDTPAGALGIASRRLQDAGSAQDSGRREILSGDPLPDADRGPDDVQIAHFDVDDATGKYTDQLNEFDTFIQIEQGYAALMKHMREAHDSLSFFVGGDNVIAVCSAMDEAAYRDAIDHVRERVGVELKVGVGRARTAQSAGMTAKHELERCREDGTAVELGW